MILDSRRQRRVTIVRARGGEGLVVGKCAGWNSIEER